MQEMFTSIVDQSILFNRDDQKDVGREKVYEM